MTKEEIIAAALKVLAPSEDEEDCRERVPQPEDLGRRRIASPRRLQISRLS